MSTAKDGNLIAVLNYQLMRSMEFVSTRANLDWSIRDVDEYLYNWSDSYRCLAVLNDRRR